MTASGTEGVKPSAVRSRRDSTASSSGRKRRKPKTEPTSTVRVVLSTFMVYLSYQILTREDDDISTTNLHIPHLNLDTHRPNAWGNTGAAGHGGGGHASFPDPYGLGHQIAGMGSNLLHHGNIHNSKDQKASSEKQPGSLVLRILGGIGNGIYTVVSFIYRSLNSTLLLVLSLAYYLAAPLSTVFFTLSNILLSPFNITWSAVNWIWEPVGKWIGGFVLTGLGLGAGLAWIGHHIESFFKGSVGSLRDAVRGKFADSWVGKVFGAESSGQDGNAGDVYGHPMSSYPMVPVATVPVSSPQGLGYPHPVYPYPIQSIPGNVYPAHLYPGNGIPYPFVPTPFFPHPQQAVAHQYLPHSSRRKSESSRRVYITSSARRGGRSKYDPDDAQLSSPTESESELDPESILTGKRTPRHHRAGLSTSDIAKQVDLIDPSLSVSSGSAGSESSSSGSQQESPTRANGKSGRTRTGSSSLSHKRSGDKRSKAIHFHFHPGSVEARAKQEREKIRVADGGERGSGDESDDSLKVTGINEVDGETRGLRMRKATSKNN
jgi:hypothetical protein